MLQAPLISFRIHTFDFVNALRLTNSRQKPPGSRKKAVCTSSRTSHFKVEFIHFELISRYYRTSESCSDGFPGSLGVAREEQAVSRLGFPLAAIPSEIIVFKLSGSQISRK
jgi:hypothetical protein